MLEYPDERQLSKWVKFLYKQFSAHSRGIFATNVPSQLEHLVSALVYEAGRADEECVALAGKWSETLR